MLPDRGPLRIEHHWLDVGTVLANAAIAVQPLLDEKRQTLTINLPEPLPQHRPRRSVHRECGLRRVPLENPFNVLYALKA